MCAHLLELSRLQKNQWKSPEALAVLQFGKLRQIVRHAYENVPFYRQHFEKAGFFPQKIKKFSDISLIPPVTRSQLQVASSEEILTQGVRPDNCKQVITAGSSGQPLRIYMTSQEARLKDMVWARTALANGRGLTDRCAYIKYPAPSSHWFERLGIWSRINLCVYDSYEDWIKVIRRSKPPFLRGNAFELARFADTLLAKGVQDIRLKAVFSISSLLDNDKRERIQKAFGCEVFDCYGSAELGCIAWECSEHKGLHINVDTTVVEFLHKDEPAQPGQRARLVCTNLQRFAMPIIRYEIGDIGVLNNESCSCGRGLPLMASLEGRADDFFLCSDGRLISPSILVSRLKKIQGLYRFRLVQKHIDVVEAFVVPQEKFSGSLIESVDAALKEMLGRKIELKIRLMNELPRDPQQKIRSLISEVNRDGLF